MAPRRNLACSVMAAASIFKIWEWSKEDNGDPDRTTELPTGCFKMKLSRKTDIQEEKDSKLTHKEEQTTVIEVTYNYGVAEYSKGNASAQQKPE